MRNLRSIRRSVLSPTGDFLTASAWDVATDCVICSFGPTTANSLIQLKRWKSHEESSGKFKDVEDITSWEAPCPLPDLDCDSVLSLQYFSDSSTVCLVLEGGDIIVVREAPQHGEEKIEIVGSVDAGISAATWSPDGDLLAIVTRADTLLYMTRDFENVTNIIFTLEDLKASKHVSVGWGKAETQFKGKRAKVLRDPTMPEKVDEGLQSYHDDQACTISWRGDGAYVAINSLQVGSRRVIRVYSREGILDSVSEPVDGLESPLSWRPSGNLLTGIQRLENRIDVVFFERNGLRHGQFALRLSKDEMEDWGSALTLKWNADSSVLAVCLRDRVQLWTMGNYHYYLKQEVPLISDEPNKKPTLFTWHPEKALCCTVGSPGSLQKIEYIFHIATSAPMPPDDYGIVAVIDGKILNMTPLRIANIPPPMALNQLPLTFNAIDVAISNPKKGRRDAHIAVLGSTEVSLYNWHLIENSCQPPSLYTSQVVSDVGENGYSQKQPDLANQQIVFLSTDLLLLLQSHSTGNRILTYRMKDDALILIKSADRLAVQCIFASLSDLEPGPYFCTTDGQITYDPTIVDSTTDVRPTAIAKFPKSIRKVELAYQRTENFVLKRNTMVESLPNETIIAFGLTLHGALFADQRCLTKDCTSFLLTPAHLIYTTAQHLLKFVHLTRVSDLEIPPDAPEVDERCRSIERGARLVTVIPSIFALVLQMPRGNLETIYPRALVLAGIRRHIDDWKYKKAFLACRNHRVDMNILHDYSPEGFVANLASFVQQVQKVEYIDLFLSQLREEDVSQTMYKQTLYTDSTDTNSLKLKPVPESRADSTTSKVNRICDAMLEVLRPRASSNLQNIISAHVCKNPPDLEAGLIVVAKLQKNDPDQAEKAVEHICFLADVNRLYDNALGLYDLDLTLLVAQQSQKDPREYLPFLQKLQEIDVLQKQYAIDDYLRRYRKALRHLNDLSDFEAFKAYTVKHSLYEDALQLNRYHEENSKSIMYLYANYLEKESRHKEAGITYEYLNDCASACESYRLAHLWRESLSCATLVPLEASALKAHALTLAESLLELKDYHSVAIIQLDYLNDLEAGARMFCKGYFFAEAIRVLGLHQRSDLLEPIIDAGLIDGMASMTELLAECRGQMNAQVPRLRELRVKKADEPLAFFDGDVNGGADIPDNVSLAATDASTTGGSLFTRYTNQTGTVGTNATRQTSKNRRREERKRARGKKGSVYEEEYLVNSIGRLIVRLNTVGDEVGRLVVGLMRRGMRERAKAVEGAMVEAVALCRDAVGEVFQDEGKVTNPEAERGEGGTERPKGGDGVLWDSIAGVQATIKAPIIKDFEKLSLFGG